MDRDSELTRGEVKLLWQFEGELQRMRDELANAREISVFPGAGESRHPVLGFAFNRVPAAVIERTLLRLAEALDPYLHRASKQFLHAPIMVRAGRDWIAHDESYRLLIELRHYRVAHFVRLRSHADSAFDKVKAQFGDIFAFLEHILDKLQELMVQLDHAGLYEPREGLSGVTKVVRRFGQADLEKLVASANSIEDADPELAC